MSKPAKPVIHQNLSFISKCLIPRLVSVATRSEQSFGRWQNFSSSFRNKHKYHLYFLSTYMFTPIKFQYNWCRSDIYHIYISINSSEKFWEVTKLFKYKHLPISMYTFFWNETIFCFLSISCKNTCEPQLASEMWIK